MPYANIEDQRKANREWRKKNPEKSRASCAKWVEQNRDKKVECNRRARGEVGSAKREAFNERRRLRRKREVLRELEASRKHKESLREFITRRAA